jgi:ubiquinone/menaquinone biosynthesis C-methylase UbiE
LRLGSHLVRDHRTVGLSGRRPYAAGFAASRPRPRLNKEGLEPRELRAGGSTAAGGVVDYRLDKVACVIDIVGCWLDCGCCDGEYTVALRARGAQLAIGLDIDEKRVAGARDRWSERAGVEFVAGEAEALPFQDQTFDGVLLNEVLEHVSDQDQTLAQLWRVLTPGGVLALFSPNRWFPFEGHGMIVGSRNFPSPVPLLPWLPRSISLPLMKARNYWPYELRRLLVHANFEIVHVGFAFPLFGHYPWLPRWTIERYLSALPRIERLPLVRRVGVSTFLLARRPQ